MPQNTGLWSTYVHVVVRASWKACYSWYRIAYFEVKVPICLFLPQALIIQSSKHSFHNLHKIITLQYGVEQITCSNSSHFTFHYARHRIAEVRFSAQNPFSSRTSAPLTWTKHPRSPQTLHLGMLWTSLHQHYAIYSACVSPPKNIASSTQQRPSVSQLFKTSSLSHRDTMRSLVPEIDTAKPLFAHRCVSLLDLESR
jgi:hypothetical protein